ncbi:MAG TPA: chemotaxis protein CheW [Reyranella sp.]|nr:chemotaxis protein CheW [Reyranella sp.]
MASALSSDTKWTGFELEGQAFALPAGHVERVLSAGQVTALPFAPSGIEGVASVSGDVVPVLALAGLLFPERPAPAQPGEQFMVVMVAGQRFALRIDRVLFVATALSQAEGETQWQGQAVTCLDPQALGLAGLAPSRPLSGVPGAIANSRDNPSEVGATRAATTILAVEAAGRTYGLPSQSVLELLDQAAVTPLPLVPPALRGIAVLRGQPLLAFSLDRLLGGAGEAAPGGHVVLSVGRSRLVLLVDAIRGLQRLSEDPSLADPTMLDPATLIPADLLALAAQLPGTADAAPARDTSRQRFLCVSLGSRTYALALAAVERVLPPRQSVILPAGAPAGVDGAIEYGGRIVPVTEGWRWLSLGETGTTGAHIVLRQDGEQRVLAVNGVQRIVTIARDDILPTAGHDPRIAALGTANGRSVEILSTAALMSRRDAA